MNDFFALRGRFRNESNGSTLCRSNEEKLLLNEAITIIEDAIENKAIDLPKAISFIDKVRKKRENTHSKKEDEKNKAIRQAVYKIINQIEGSLEQDIEHEYECPFCNKTAYFMSYSMGFARAECKVCGYNEPL